jgi:protein-tyrosine kinase
MSLLRNAVKKANWLENTASSTVSELNQNAPFDGHRKLAQIPADEVAITERNRILYHTEPDGVAADRFRLLRMRLQAIGNTSKLKKLLITSPLPGEGKSTMVLNLATALSGRGKRAVLVVEADLYHAPLINMLELPCRPGLAECLETGINPSGAITRIKPLEWYLLPAGKASANPTDLLQGEQFPSVLDQLGPHFDWILIDSPPVIPVAATLSISNHCDGSLLVVRAGSTSQDAVEEAIGLIGRQRVIGVLLNGIGARDLVYSKYGSGSYYSYQSRNGQPLVGSE